MKLLRTIVWLGFFACIAFYLCQYCSILCSTGVKLRMFNIDFVTPAEGVASLQGWLNRPYGSHNLLYEAIINTRVDCVFIICYVSVMFMLSYHQMQKKTSVTFNALLRLSLLLCFVTGLLDYIENFILFGNFNRAVFGGQFISPQWASWPKFIIAAWVTLLWLISLITKNDTSSTAKQS